MRTTATASTAGPEPAAERPVARVCVDVPLAHLDRPFDYLVPATLAEQAQPGCRVRVRFAGRSVGGYLLDRVDDPEQPRRLTPLSRVVSPEPVLCPQVARLARAVADRYAGTLADVLRLAVPPRHAAVEAEDPAAAGPGVPTGERDDGDGAEDTGWPGYPRAGGWLAALRAGRPARAVLTALPGDHVALLAAAVRAVRAAGRGVLIVVPGVREVEAFAAGLAEQGLPPVLLTADLPAAERYRRWLAVRRGHARLVLGTRAAAFAPVHALGLVAIWDDGDDLHAEQHAPYPHAREVLLLRAEQSGAAALLAGYAQTAEAAALVSSGWAHRVTPTRAAVRSRVAAVQGADADPHDPYAEAARLPALAWRHARSALDAGRPVLVQVARTGYQPALACADCRAGARCGACNGPLTRHAPPAEAGSPAGDAPAPVPSCGWCGVPAPRWRCPSCGGSRLRSVVAGAARTAEELGRAFPRVPVRTATGSRPLRTVPARPLLVVATPGAEPAAAGGYGAALLLDAWLQLGRPDLRAGEETLRRWANAAALVSPDGGQVVVAAAGAVPAVQALLRWDAPGFADRELAERRELQFPPAARMAALEGSPAALQDLLGHLELPASATVLGPTPFGTDAERLLVRVPRRDGARLSAALKAATAVRSARHGDPVRVRVDPSSLG